MKVINIKQNFEMSAVFVRVQFIVVLFFATNYLSVDWSLISVQVCAMAIIVFMAIIGDCFGFIVYAFYLVKVNKAGEVDRWARNSQFSVAWRNYTKSILSKYAKKHH